MFFGHRRGIERQQTGMEADKCYMMLHAMSIYVPDGGEYGSGMAQTLAP